MPEIDDGDFGDFKFAPPTPNPTVPSNQINGWGFPATDNDDEWGDFSGHTPTKALPNSQSLPLFPEASSPSHRFGASPVPVENSSPWSRRQGALPLSLFGEEEMQEERSGAVFPSLSPRKSGDSMRKSSSLSAGVPLSDLIGNLYDQGHQINPQNGVDSNSGRKSNETIAGTTVDSSLSGDASLIAPEPRNPSSFDVGGVGSNDFIENPYDQSHQIKSPNGLNSNSNSNGWDLNTNGSQPSTVDSSLGGASLLPPKIGNYHRKTTSVGFDDSYDQSQQIKPQNEVNSETKVSVTGARGDAGLSPLQSSNSMRKASSFNVFGDFNDLIGNWDDQNHSQNGLNSNSNGSDLKAIQSTAGTGNTSLGTDASLVSPKTGNSMRKASSLSAGVGMGLNDLIAQLYDQSNQPKPQNGDSQRNENVTGVSEPSLDVNTDLNGLNKEAVDGNEHSDVDDEDDDGWEFKVAEAETGAREGASAIKVDGNGQQSFGRAENIYDVGSGTKDLLGTPVVTSNKSGEWDFGFDFNPNFPSQDGISSSYTKNIPDDTANRTNWSPSGDKLDSDEFIWEFKNASSEVGSTHKLKEPEADDVHPAGSKALGVSNTANVSNGSIDALDMMSHGSDSYQSKQNDIENGLTSSSVKADVKYDGNLWGFDDSFPETGSKHETIVDDKQKLCESGLDYIMFSSQNGGKDFGQNSKEFKGVLPGITAEDQNPQNGGLDSSMFTSQSGADDFGRNSWELKGVLSETKAQEQNSQNDEFDSSMFNSPRGGDDDFGQSSWEFKGAVSGIKAEDQTSVDDIQKHFGKETDPTKTTFNSVLVEEEEEKDDDDDDFGVDSWEFKGALPGTSVKEQTYDDDTQKLCENRSEFTSAALQPNLVNGHDISWDFKGVSSGSKVEDKSSDSSCEGSYERHPTMLYLDKYLDLYEKLKDELSYITNCHLDNLKKNQSDGALSGEDGEDKAPCDDIQEIYNELHQENIELHAEDNSERTVCLNELLEVLKEPIFQMLESEYDISERLSVAAKDLRSAIELLKHVVLTLKILRLGSAEEQFSYVSTWYRIISVCAEELEHGASIWNQSLQKNVLNQILSGPQGKSYILGLGEIYRVVEVVGASAKLYKPWVLLCSANPTALFALANKCRALWSSPGIQEALNTFSDPVDFRYDGTISGLQASIKSIHDLDELTLKKHVLPQQEPICRLSLLGPDTALGMKLVVWEQEHYLVKVANLWANLVSHDPPNLRHIHDSS